MIRQLLLLTVAIAALAVFGSYILFRRMIPFRTKGVVIEMSWKRGDNHYGLNFISLESRCLSNSAPGCFCVAEFKDTMSTDFADYIESFGTSKVPVKYRVDYDRKHRVVGASLESVGTRPSERFHDNLRSLATGFRMVAGEALAGGHINNPGDCLPAPVN